MLLAGFSNNAAVRCKSLQLSYVYIDLIQGTWVIFENFFAGLREYLLSQFLGPKKGIVCILQVRIAEQAGVTRP